jgi:fused signal recognition particle receptor
VALRFLQKIGQKISHVFGRGQTNFNSLDDLEATLYGADLGRTTVECILAAVKDGTDHRLPITDVLRIVRDILRRELEGAEGRLIVKAPPEVICLVGVNGVGKTTTAAKLGAHFTSRGMRVLLGSCDTFRAAANAQIGHWMEKLRLDWIASQRGGDAAAVAYDALSAAIARGSDLLILDTAGRLHTKSNLLEELGKLQRVMKKRLPNAIYHRWLVIDGNVGGNSLEQGRAFHEAFSLTGSIVAKMDSTARGGALVPIYRELKLPVYFMGTGEKPDDLQPFKVEEYLDGLLGKR